MNERVLRTLKFGCRCGLEGNLAEIKDHLWKGEVEHELPESRPSAFPSSQGPNERSRGSRVMPVPTFQTKGFFWMQILELSTKCQSSNQLQKSTSAQEWKAGGYVFELLCQVQPGSNKDQYVGLILRLPANKPSAVGWPVKKRIIVQLHNTDGKSVAKHEVITYDNGKVISDVFLAPSSGNYVVDRLAKFKDLRNASGLTKDGFACFSVELHNIQP
ncbi:hypothetical protein BIW11_13808 [Tropilaelaps mercedesae]|nr:hypothetical protein BIW11_13808 [Tropilaelaps mercedesae]OQR66976.1 hypothetical protein BIW11_13808 [Tropilaelaps mercedesae]